MPFPTIEQLLSSPHQTFTLSDDTKKSALDYFERVKTDRSQASRLLQAELEGLDLQKITVDNFLQTIINTKRPKNFAEQILVNNDSRSNSGYNDSDLAILAEIGTVFPTYVYNDGEHTKSWLNHDQPLPCLMGFISAPLFTKGNGSLDDADLVNPAAEGKLASINTDRYQEAIERRLLPTLLQMNAQAKDYGKRLSVTIPGLGCGHFGGSFGDSGDGSIYNALNNALITLLDKHGAKLDHIEDVLLDTHMIAPADVTTASLPIKYQCVATFFCEPSVKRKQLQLNATDKNKSNIMLATIVAADLLSWAGNDMWEDARKTDEGVKAGSSLVLLQIASRMNPALAKLEYNYNASEGAIFISTQTWKNIGDILKSCFKYASAETPIVNYSLVVAPSPMANHLSLQSSPQQSLLEHPEIAQRASTSENEGIGQSQSAPPVPANPMSNKAQSATLDTCSPTSNTKENGNNQSPFPTVATPKAKHSTKNCSFFSFKLLAALSAGSTASLLVGALIVVGSLTAPFGLGVGLLAFGATVVSASMVGIFYRKAENQDKAQANRANILPVNVN